MPIKKPRPRPKPNTHPLWRRWTHIRSCYTNPNYKDYHYVHELGIDCYWQTWRSFRDGVTEEIGLPPTPQHRLNRINLNRGWYPGNLRWATAHEIGQCQRHVLTVKIAGKKYTLKEACRQYQKSYDSARRLYHLGYRGLALIKAAYDRA